MTITTLIASLLAFVGAFLASRAVLSPLVATSPSRRRGGPRGVLADAQRRASAWVTTTGFSKTLLPRVQSDLAQAGRDREVAADWVGAAIVRSVLVGSIVAVLVVAAVGRSSSIVFALLAAIVIGGISGASVFAYLLNELRREAFVRVRRIVRLLPYSIELIILVAQAGGSLEDGLKAIITSMPTEPLAQEVSRVLGERDIGRPLAEAFKSMADRLLAKEVIQLVTTIEIGRELGTPTAESLSGFGEWLRVKRVLDGEKMAREAAPKMALPNTLIMVANVLLILAPFVPNLFGGL